MALQPTDEAIDAFVMMVPGISRSEVISRLKGNNNNVDQAVGEYFDSPDSSQKYRYDESQFHSDRDGTIHNPGVSFQVQGPDEYGPSGPSGRFDGAMSRPPSRVNNKSPLSKVIDLTAEHALADPKLSMGYDEDLQQAIALSLGEGLPPQESGVTGTNQVHFGPANRSQYEQGKWEMVPIGQTSVQEILLDPEPADRKRNPDTPAFLKPTFEDHRLAALITIYHEIPMMRGIFLSRKNIIPNYGHDKDWWNGKPIELPMVVEDGLQVEPMVDHELQRLMAFLDMTDRSYGSIGALTKVPAVQRLSSQSKQESAVLDAWRQLYADVEANGAIPNIYSRGVQNESESAENHDFAILELDLPLRDSYKETIYDIADVILWPDHETPELMESAFLSQIGEIITLKISGNDFHKAIEIPATFYPDRYLLQNREAAWKMRADKQEVLAKLDQLKATEERLTEFQTRNGKYVKVQDLLKAAMKHDHAAVDEAKIGECGDSDDIDVEMAGSRSTKSADLSAKLRKIIESIDSKLTSLKEEREKALETMRGLSKLYTAPSDDPSAPKLTRYTLRGVSTTRSTTYILRRPKMAKEEEPDLIDLEITDENGNIEEEKRQEDQWWRIQYSFSGSSPVTIEKTTEAQVLQAAKTESKKITLVYASDKAMEPDTEPLPPPLENFVRWDNAAFKREFTDNEDAATQVSSPGKRKRFALDDSSPEPEVTTISEREFQHSSDPGGSHHTTLNIMDENPKVINGYDPYEMADNDDDDSGRGQEMQERAAMLMLNGRRVSRPENPEAGGVELSDNRMEVDRVMEDTNSAVESAAVQQVDISQVKGG